jgi:hypothetical protein
VERAAFINPISGGGSDMMRLQFLAKWAAPVSLALLGGVIGGGGPATAQTFDMINGDEPDGPIGTITFPASSGSGSAGVQLNLQVGPTHTQGDITSLSWRYDPASGNVTTLQLESFNSDEPCPDPAGGICEPTTKTINDDVLSIDGQYCDGQSCFDQMFSFPITIVPRAATRQQYQVYGLASQLLASVTVLISDLSQPAPSPLEPLALAATAAERLNPGEPFIGFSAEVFGVPHTSENIQFISWKVDAATHELQELTLVSQVGSDICPNTSGEVCSEITIENGVFEAEGQTCEGGSCDPFTPIRAAATYVAVAADDQDGDGVPDDADNCPLEPNADQTDTDGDDQGDACDLDDDNDMVDDGADNCPLVPNLDQADFDDDGQGDACDLDGDGDGINDASDRCLDTTPGEVADADGCAIAQLCPCDTPWKNHGKYVSCVAQAAEDFVDGGLVSGPEKDAIVSAAGRSQCGKKTK